MAPKSNREAPVALTDLVLRNAKKGEILREQGLEFRFFLPGKAGVRFIGRVRGTNARVSISLGRYPALTLQAARHLCVNQRGLCEQGIDPRYARLEKASQDQQMVGPLVKEYLSCLTDNRKSTVNDKRSVLGTALKSMERLPIRRFGKGEVARLMDSYADKPAARRKLFSYLSHFFAWCQDRDLVAVNPCRQIRGPKPVPARRRVLTDPEISALMGLRDSAWGTMLKLVLLTGQRGGEVCRMRLEEIDLCAKIWNLPSVTMKQGVAHSAPLSDAALCLLRDQLAKLPDGWGPYVFGFGSMGRRPFNGRSNGMEQVHSLTGTTGWSGHDCRRTAITLMQRLGVSREVRMRVTGHALPRDGASSYEHHDFKKEAFAAVENLAQGVARISLEQAPE